MKGIFSSQILVQPNLFHSLHFCQVSFTQIPMKFLFQFTFLILAIYYTESEDTTDGMPRRSSFVGTAQYVSPEILTDKRSSPASDLWAIGCILYQMLDGNPPFQARHVWAVIEKKTKLLNDLSYRSEYAIFQKILKLEFDFPANFPEVAKDFVTKLLVCKVFVKGVIKLSMRFLGYRFERTSWSKGLRRLPFS